MIEGSIPQLLVISQFSQFFDVMAHISADRHLSKISCSYFYTPWPPLTFEAIIFFWLKQTLTSAETSTVKDLKKKSNPSKNSFETTSDLKVRKVIKIEHQLMIQLLVETKL